ncbi:hypothetical protein HYPP_03813 [Hyphomicrobium sp. ghe19]|nr:hypothetical protein HYPP_03813 [Hyphomicrobium sp. ghe19]
MPEAAVSREDVEKFERECDRDNRRFGFFVLATFAACVALVLGVQYFRVPPQMQKTPVLPDIFVDPATGCQYLKFYSGVTPRLLPDGTPFCVKQTES